MPLLRRLCAAFLVSVLWILPATGGELVMIQRDGCHWCERWNEEIGHVYPKTAESRRAPLRRVNIEDLPDDISFETRPVYTPTFVLVDGGEELDRIEGYPGADFFWPMLERMLDAHPDATVPRPAEPDS
ncbi:hypothetical protein [Roseovarius sp. SYSU LYC5161]|uniref:hypothetical protein n=1 Tax=Roseovarius halophilus (ex Wu et al. 2025) TaxID=3376060 RepID=UPI002872485E|nr:hypothetical protein [Roseovarius sp.]